MRSSEFKGNRLVYIKYGTKSIPVHAYRTDDGRVITSYTLTWKERLRLIITGRIWSMQFAGGKPFQPQLLSLNPFLTLQ